MKSERTRIHRKVLAAESAAIVQFTFDACIQKTDSKLPMKDVFQKYHEWRKELGLSESVLSIDGFGKLFPPIYPRESSYWAPAKHALKCIFGLALK